MRPRFELFELRYRWLRKVILAILGDMKISKCNNFKKPRLSQSYRGNHPRKAKTPRPISLPIEEQTKNGPAEVVYTHLKYHILEIYSYSALW